MLWSPIKVILVLGVKEWLLLLGDYKVELVQRCIMPFRSINIYGQIKIETKENALRAQIELLQTDTELFTKDFVLNKSTWINTQTKPIGNKINYINLESVLTIGKLLSRSQESVPERTWILYLKNWRRCGQWITKWLVSCLWLKYQTFILSLKQVNLTSLLHIDHLLWLITKQNLCMIKRKKILKMFIYWTKRLLLTKSKEIHFYISNGWKK